MGLQKLATVSVRALLKTRGHIGWAKYLENTDTVLEYNLKPGGGHLWIWLGESVFNALCGKGGLEMTL